jgi:alpha-D-ribose 1-methylphosphonate 5-triphosphate diphosphatase
MWLTDLQIVLPDSLIERGAIKIDGDRIGAVVQGECPAGPGEPQIEASGMIALPGLIDLYGDMLEREIEPRPGSIFPLEAALHEYDKRLAGAGITTACAALTLDGPESHWRSRRPAYVHQAAHAVREHRGSLLTDLHVHLRCDSTPADAVALVDMLLSDGLCWMVGLRGPYGKRPSIVDIIQPYAALLSLHDPARNEEIAFARDIGGAMVFFPRSAEIIAAARQVGLHTVFGAPNVVRGGSHNGGPDARDAIRAGLVDLLVTDESPITLLQAIFILVRERVLPLPEAAALATHKPADVLGLTDRGRIMPGALADLILVERDPLPHVRMTIRRGIPIYRRGL